MNLYYGGFGNYQEFVVAESEQDAITKIGVKINAPYLPITADKIEEIDSFTIVPMQFEDIPGTEELAGQNEKIRCKKCDFVCDQPWEMAQHSRKAHPKGA